MIRKCQLCGAEILPPCKSYKYCNACKKRGYSKASKKYNRMKLNVGFDDYLTPPKPILEGAEREVDEYNAAHGTKYSYGMHTHLKDSGRLEK